MHTMTYVQGMINRHPQVRWDIGFRPRETLAAVWLHEPQTISKQCGFPTMRGGITPGDPCFRRLDVGIVEVWRDF